ELVARRGADEFAGLLGEQLVDGAGIFALDRFASEDDGARVDLALCETRIVVAAAKKSAEPFRIDGAVRQERRQQDRRAPGDLAADHDEAARQPLRLALQRDLGEE